MFDNDIVIVGMGCRFPGAISPDLFWNNLIQKISTFSKGDYNRTTLDVNDDIAVKTKAEINNVFDFDASKFSISEEELIYVDPQQRILLELVFELFVKTGYSKKNTNRNIGVFVGVCYNSYLELVNSRFFEDSFIKRMEQTSDFKLLKHSEQQKIKEILVASLSPKPRQPNMIAGNLLNLIPNRISHEFDLKGPSIAIETACSSSLVAFHDACESLRNGNCTTAIAAGVQLNVTPIVNYFMETAGAVSKKGTLTPFDENADGMLLGEGAGVVLLKRYEDAVKNGDDILAFVKASGVNNDGKSMGILAPNLRGQCALIDSIYAKYGINPDDITAIEAHGTGTRIGDAIEIKTLKSIFGKRKKPLFIGAVKSNIGHLLGGAGIASIIKSVLCLQNKIFPSNLGVQSIPEKWKLEDYNFNVLKKNVVYKEEGPLLIGINAFGFGGTNCHVVLSDENTTAQSKAPSVKWTRKKYLFNDISEKFYFSAPSYTPVTYPLIETRKQQEFLLLVQDQVLNKQDLLPFVDRILIEEVNLDSTLLQKDIILYFNKKVDKSTAIIKTLFKIKKLFSKTNNERRYTLILDNLFDTGFGNLLFTLFAGIGLENRNIITQIICKDSHQDSVLLLKKIIGRKFDTPIFIRSGKLYKRSFKRIHLSASAQKIKQESWNLFLGGTSGIGLEFCKHFLQNDRKVLVAGRTDEANFRKNLAGIHFPDQNLKYLQLDVLDNNSSNCLINDLKTRHLTLSNCFFSLGVTVKAGSFLKKDDQLIEKQIDIKIKGISLLADLLNYTTKQPHVFICSSSSSLRTQQQKGILDYALGNAFLDGAARQYDFYLINWCALQNTGQSKQIQNNLLQLPVKQAMNAFNQIEQSTEKQLLVNKLNDNIPFKGHQKEIVLEKVVPQKQKEDKKGIISNAQLKTLIINEISILLDEPAENIDTKDTFQDLGIDSLDAIDLVRKIEQEFSITLDQTLLFEHNTIEKVVSVLSHTEERKKTRIIDTQKSFLIAQQLQPLLPNNISLRVQFTEGLETGKMKDAFVKILNIYPELKLGFSFSNENAYGSYHSLNYEPVMADWQGEKEVLVKAQELMDHIYELEKPPLLQVILFQENHILKEMLFSCHHILLDGWSIMKIIQKVFSFYKDPTFSGPEQMSSLLNDYVESLSFLAPENENHDYWQNQLKGFKTFQIPYSGKRVSQSGKWVSSFSKTETKKLEDFVLENDCSLFELLLSIYILVIQQLTNRDDVIIGIANINRNRHVKNAFNVIGSLANSLPFRYQQVNEKSFSQYLDKIKKLLKQNLLHANISAGLFNKIIEKDEQIMHNRLSPFGLSYLNLDKKKKFYGLAKDIQCSISLSFTDISLLSAKFEGKLFNTWNFNTADFTEKTILKFVNKFNGLIKKVISGESLDTDLHLKSVDSLSMPKTKLFPAQVSIHEKVLEACETYARNIAVKEIDSEINYSELKDQIIEVANALHRVVDDAALVSIFSHPSLAAIKGINGILVSGKAYLPLDPSWPDKRILQIIRHSKVKIICCPIALLDRLQTMDLSETSVEQIVVLDGPNPEIPWIKNIRVTSVLNENKTLDFQIISSKEDLAYVMYTSGTTGIPKGVMVSHKSAEIFLNWLQDAFEVNENDRFAGTSSLGFGGSIRQIFSTLLTGATYIPVSKQTIRNPNELPNFIRNYGITILNTVPSIWSSLIDYLNQNNENLPSLRLLLIGGEAMPVHLVENWNQLNHTASVFNLYGSTETLVNATFYDISLFNERNSPAVPIGQTRSGVVVQIISEEGIVCATGEPGYIAVGGQGISSGYYLDPKLTQEKYVESNGMYFYNTGDLGYRDFNGDFHYKGRKDSQIQLYGNRIELSEISNVINQLNIFPIAETVHIQVENTLYIAVFVESEKVDIQEKLDAISNEVRDRLPSYMEPHFYYPIDKMPRNVAGKIDLSNLREIAMQKFSKKSTSQESQSQIEHLRQMLLQSWKELLKIDNIGIHDDFFNLGGHSMIVIFLSVRIQDSTGFSIPPYLLYKYRTIDKLCRYLSKKEVDKNSWAKINPRKLSNGEKGFVLAQKLRGKSPLCCAKINLAKNVNHEILNQTFNQLIHKHPILRSVFLKEKSGVLLHPIETYQYEIQNRHLANSEATKKQISQYYENIKTSDFAIDKWPLFKIEFISSENQPSCLIIAMHHLITDAWSFNIMFTEINSIYKKLSKGTNITIIQEDEKYMAAREKNLQLELKLQPGAKRFWENNLKNIQTHPIGHHVEPTVSEGIVELRLEESLSQKLKDIARKQGSSLFILMLGNWIKAIQSVLNNNHFLLGISQSGREELGVSGTTILGCFAKGVPFPVMGNLQKNHKDIKAWTDSLSILFSACCENNQFSLSELNSLLDDEKRKGLLGYQYFFSFMDYSAFENTSEENVLLSEDTDFHYKAENTGTHLMMGVTVSSSIQINVSGLEGKSIKREVLEKFHQFLNRTVADSSIAKKKIDSALIAYLPSKSYLEKIKNPLISKVINRITRSQNPYLIETTQTEHGVSGLILLPVFADKIMQIPQEELKRLTTNAIFLAQNEGASVVSLAGNLPSRLDYGFALAKNSESIWAKITTGHTTTVVAVILNTLKVLEITNINLVESSLGIVGFGSIGKASLELLLILRETPREIIVFDLPRKIKMIQSDIDRIRKEYGVNIKAVPVIHKQVPDSCYETDILIVAATSPNIINVRQLKEGAIIIDDSFPPALDEKEGIKRMKEQKDVLIIGAGKIYLPILKSQLEGIELPDSFVSNFTQVLTGNGIPGCRAESILIAAEPGLPLTIGLVKKEQAHKYWEYCQQLGIEAGKLHLGAFEITNEIIENVRRIRKGTH